MLERRGYERADQRLQSFMKDLLPELPAYVPGKLIAEN